MRQRFLAIELSLTDCNLFLLDVHIYREELVEKIKPNYG